MKIKSIVDSLLDVGDPVSDQDHIDAILEGLPEEYNPFIMVIYGRHGSPSIADIEALLLVQEAQFDKFKQELVMVPVSANVG